MPDELYPPNEDSCLQKQAGAPEEAFFIWTEWQPEPSHSKLGTATGDSEGLLNIGPPLRALQLMKATPIEGGTMQHSVRH